MCGIVGYAGPAPTGGRELLHRMADTLVHRGPDAQGQAVMTAGHGAAEIGFGHRRLAIVDLEGGIQPMANADASIRVICNGEIYNHHQLRQELQALGHRFATRSDTETIVHAYAAWGADCVQRLRGMFAFALWDARQETLLLARDRFGEKPLHYTQINGTLVFASELRALRAWPGIDTQLNTDVLPHYLQYRYVPGPATWMRGVHKLPPGCTLHWTAATGPRVQRYYRPHDAAPGKPEPVTDAEAASRVLGALDEAVGLMMDSDVPYGAFLSGGLDSSAIVALMARRSAMPVRTFSIGFEHHGYSELEHAATVAQAFGTDHRAMTVNDSEIVALLPAVAALRDGPIAEPADVALYLLAQEARRSVKMVLTGEGSDEALGGYPKHVMERLAPAYRAVPRLLRRSLVEPLGRALPQQARRTRIALQALSVDRFEDRMPRWFGALSAQEVQRLCGSLPQPLRNGAAYPFESDPGASPLRRILYFDQTSWLPDNLLERGDRMTMAASIEARLPFMDHVFVECAAALPDPLRVQRSQTKRVLRQAMSALLPPGIIKRRKMGFNMPVQLWLRTSLRELMCDSLLGPGSVSGRLFDRPTIERHVMDHLLGRGNHEKLLWMLLNFELWARQARLSV